MADALRAARATRLVFFVFGFAAGAWAPLVPFAKDRLALADGPLGLLLLAIGVGSIVAMPLAGALAARFGCRPVIVVALAGICLVFPLMAELSLPWTMAAALFVFGASVGSADCVVNIQGIAVERAAGRPMMSGFHARYSLGGIAGSTVVSALIALAAAPWQAALVATAIMLAAIVAAWPGLLTDRADEPGPMFALPHGIVLVIGACCFVLFLAEGSALDWSAVFLRNVRRADAAQAGLAYAAFSTTMTLGRLAGDRLVGWIGQVRAIGLGALVGAIGLALATLAPSWPASVAGYALLGAGCSNVVPALFSLIGRQRAMPEGRAVAAVSVLGYAGILSGPAGIGLVASVTSLPAALLGVAALLLAVALAARPLGRL